MNRWTREPQGLGWALARGHTSDAAAWKASCFVRIFAGRRIPLLPPPLPGLGENGYLGTRGWRVAPDPGYMPEPPPEAQKAGESPVANWPPNRLFGSGKV
jgi:hypothetical protein